MICELAGCAFLWHSQQKEPIAHEDVSLVVLAPTITGPLREELRLVGCEANQHEPGIFRVTGLPFSVWLVETDAMAEMAEPVLSLVSRSFLNDSARIMEALTRTGHRDVLSYIVQQIHQFKASKGFAMQHGMPETIEELDEKFTNDFLATLPAEQRLRAWSRKNLQPP